MVVVAGRWGIVPRHEWTGPLEVTAVVGEDGVRFSTIRDQNGLEFIGTLTKRAVYGKFQEC